MRCVGPPRFFRLMRKSAGFRGMILTLALVQDFDPGPDSNPLRVATPSILVECACGSETDQAE
jgi:hypothetical protein